MTIGHRAELPLGIDGCLGSGGPWFPPWFLSSHVEVIALSSESTAWFMAEGRGRVWGSGLEQHHLYYILLIRVSQRSVQNQGVRTGLHVGREGPPRQHTGVETEIIC